MKFYNMDTVFSFGKYKGKTLKEVVDLQDSYLDWCIQKLNHFYISESIILEITKQKPSFELSEQAKVILDAKYCRWQDEQEKKKEMKSLQKEKNTHNRYEGTYAQDVEFLSDDFIDSAFGGEADAYWNID